MMDVVRVTTSKEVEIIDITEKVREIVRKSGVEDGIVVVFTKHTTAGIIINENESGLISDLEKTLEKLIPKGAGYSHDRIDNNAHSHLRAIILGSSVVIPVENGRLALGTWQSVLFVELDGPRTREIYVKVCKC
ncbi:secondary thiamine-phosphate synthase enzyme YjbQ [Pyrococcus kukulkanii]|uniref:Secondary thiamine-phosphate synthase enzyme YjbQ n=2 Tax=Pyrococcus kukulkanii TaxID=1609559 RepID=A0ABV4T532_9EURY